MKKMLTMLCGSLIVLLLFVGSGNVALAKNHDDCGCEEHGIFPVMGSEKNKIIANLLGSNEFKTKKMELLKEGYSWRGVKEIQVVEFISEEGRSVGIAIPFYTINGPEVVVFVDGVYQDPELLKENQTK